MEDTTARAVAIVGVGAVLPEAPSAAAFWENVKGGRYCVSDVTPERWDPALYYDPDPRAPDKTYSRIGGFVRAYDWDPAAWKLPVPPLVADSMDVAQKWAVACTRAALLDYGKPIDGERTAVILGNAMAGERHYITSMRVSFPDALRMLEQSPAFGALPADAREALRREYLARWNATLPEITEDTMPGELSNCMAGRVANLFNLKGPNYVCDAACASALAALSSAAEGLIQGHFDLALTGGVDRNMGAHTFVKFCKIGALSATGTRPYADGADGFVMGEGAALYLLKRLADAERDGDRVYAVLRGVGGSSDGRGKGITAPNPVGQKLAVRRGWAIAGLDPATASLVEGHGTSTKVGDVVEVESLGEVFGQGLPAGSVPLGSVKSNIGHLKAAAGAAGFLKLTLALHHKLLPPSLNCERKNPNIDFARSPFYVNTRLQEWPRPAAGVRRAGLSAFGFGGTNFHVVLEEHVPGALKAGDGRGRVSVGVVARASAEAGPAPSRGALVVGAATEAELVARLEQAASAAAAGKAPPFALPDPQALQAPERVAIDYGNAAELAEKATKALKACLLYTSPSPRDRTRSRMPSSA